MEECVSVNTGDMEECVSVDNIFMFLISICVQCNLIVPTITDGSETAFETVEESVSTVEESVRGFQSSYNFQRKLFQHKNPLQIVHGILEATRTIH